MMTRKNQVLNQWLASSLLMGITAMSVPIAQANPGDVNSVNNGSTIQAGTYFNTVGSRTTFQNAGGSLTLNAGDLVRGLESNASKVVTGNGGNFYLKADVIRLDGTMDVSAIRHGATYVGNGGTVSADAKYLFQNGNIFANGSNGGLLQLNVGGMTLGSNAKISAQGFGGDGGAVNISSASTVDLRQGSMVDVSGKVVGTFDTNVISIEGSAINNQGILKANGLAVGDLKTDDGDEAVFAANPLLANNPVPPPITEGSGTGNTAVMQNVLFGTPGNADFRGGTIRLVATGQSTSQAGVVNASTALSSTEKTDLNNRNAQIIQFNDGDTFNRGVLQTNGAFSKNGGTIILSASRNVVNSGTVQANGANSIDGIFDASNNGGTGGKGGTIVVTAMNLVNNTATIQANGGNGAKAGTMNLATGNGKDANLTNTAIAGNGGEGGLIAISGTNTTNTGNIQANGGVGGIGGTANTYDTENASAANPNPVARSTATGAAGGNGGLGGLVVFSGENNPTGSGTVSVNGGQGGQGGNAFADTNATSNIGTPSAIATGNAGAGGHGGNSGTILVGNPATFTTFSAKAGGNGNSGSGTFRNVTIKNGVTTSSTGGNPIVVGSATTGNNTAVLATRKNEFLSHDDVNVLLSQTGGVGTSNTTLTGRLNDSLIRTVGNAAGTSGAGGNALAVAEGSSSFVIASTGAQGLNTDLVNANTNPLFFNLNTLTILNNGNIDNNMLWTPGVHLVGAGFHDMTFSLGGGHISWLSNGTITNNQIVITRGLRTGGSINLAATQDIVNNNDFINIGPNKALISGFNIAGPLYESSHAGSLMMKAGRDITNTSNGKMASNLIFFDIHPPLNQTPAIDWPKFLNGAQIGANVNLIAGRNFVNNGLIKADALTYRNGQLGADNPALTTGGTVSIQAKTGTFTNTGSITANGNAFFSPNEADGPRFNTNTFPAATSFNGTVSTP